MPVYAKCFECRKYYKIQPEDIEWMFCDICLANKNDSYQMGR